MAKALKQTSYLAYWSWHGMVSRCYKQSSNRFNRYGGRGINMCERWRVSFWSFLEDMGERPGKDYTIERVNNDGNYEPSNCIWLIKHKQSSNRSSCVRLTFKKQTKNISDWASTIGIPMYVLWSRVKAGWSIKNCITKPYKPYNPPIVIDGISKTLTEWCSFVGKSRELVRGRIHKGWTPKKAIFQKHRLA